MGSVLLDNSLVENFLKSLKSLTRSTSKAFLLSSFAALENLERRLYAQSPAAIATAARVLYQC
ncbi:MAG: hypothetical protein ACI8XU_001442 [Kiritimatiellia bacterium]|jgi:hypothetical protein